eukprot:1670842-Prorocentrum_lima.AAC.1
MAATALSGNAKLWLPIAASTVRTSSTTNGGNVLSPATAFRMPADCRSTAPVTCSWEAGRRA